MIELATPRLELVAHCTVTLGEIAEVGDVPHGRRRVISITGGRVHGPRLTGEILPGGADWQLVRADGTAEIDTRYLMRTDAGELVVIATRGHRHGPPDVLARLSAGVQVAPSLYHFHVTVELEAAAPPLAWLNQTVFVATAARLPAAVSYDLYALA